jgi:hypothetical protein
VGQSSLGIFVDFKLPDGFPAVVRQRVSQVTDMLMSVDDQCDGVLLHGSLDFIRRAIIPPGDMVATLAVRTPGGWIMRLLATNELWC